MTNIYFVGLSSLPDGYPKTVFGGTWMQCVHYIAGYVQFYGYDLTELDYQGDLNENPDGVGIKHPDRVAGDCIWINITLNRSSV